MRPLDRSSLLPASFLRQATARTARAPRNRVRRGQRRWPGEAQPLAPDRRSDAPRALTAPERPAVSACNRSCAFDRNRFHRFAQCGLAFSKRRAIAGRCRYAHAASITTRRTCALPVFVMPPRRMRAPLRMLTRAQAAQARQLRRAAVKSREFTEFGDERDRRHPRDATERLAGVDHGSPSSSVPS